MNSFHSVAILTVIQHTPWWVHCAFAYVIWIGLSATKKRDIWVPRLFIIPAVFMVIKVASLVQHSNPLYPEYVLYGAALAVGMFIGWYVALNIPVVVHPATRSITMAGNWYTLFLVLAIFFAKYAFGYLHHTNPDLYETYHLWDLGFAGLVSGIFLGRALCYSKQLIVAH